MLQQLVQVGAWLSIVSVLGWIAFPLTRRAFPGRPELAWGLSRTVGLLVAGWVTFWLCAGLHLPFERPLVLGTFLALAVVGGALAPLGARSEDRVLSRRQALAQEAAFFLAFGLYLTMRGFNPDILVGEKLSDAMFLSALLHDTHVPPADLWLGHEPVNYYYFGYFLLSLLAKACGTPLGLAFNLSLALVFALSVGGLMALVLAWYRQGSGWQRRVGVGVALALEFLLGNLASGIRLLQDPRAVLSAVWDRIGMGATRVLTFSDQPTPGAAISEFPSFSFLFADLHPHLLAIPFSFLYLAGALRLVSSERTGPIFWGLMALTIGSFGALNSWEMPVALGVLGAAALVGAWHRSERWAAAGRRLGMLALSGAVALGAFFPFYRHFEAPHGATGVQLILGSRITLSSWLEHVGLLAFAIASWLVVRMAMARRPAGRGAWWSGVGAMLIGGAVALALHSLLLGILVATLVLVGIQVLSEPEIEHRFGLLAIGLALGLMVGADLVAVHDHSNTIFKLYVPAWTLLVLGSTHALVQLFEQRRPVVAVGAWRVGLVALTGLAAVFPLLAGLAWNHGYSTWQGVDGVGFLDGRQPDEARVVSWLRTQPEGGILEMSGPSWSEANRLAVFSGRPTWLGWVGHERLWHEGAQKARAVETRWSILHAAYVQGEVRALVQALEASQARFVIIRQGDRIADRAAELADARLQMGFRAGELMVFERKGH